MLKWISDKLRSVNWIYKSVLWFTSLFSKPLNTRNLKSFFLFIGYPRSGHTVVGALLDAHPNLMCSIEANALELFNRGYTRRLLLYFLQKRNRFFVNKLSAMWTGYSYKVENAWQGDTKNLLAIGDKKGAGTSKQLIDDFALLSEFEKTMGLPLKIIHVIRNPYDNLATIMLRAEQKGKKCDEAFFEERVCYFQRHLAVNKKVIDENPGKVLNVYHEDLIENPKKELERIVHFLEVPAEKEYIDKCAKIVYATPNQSRHKIEWPKEIKDKVEGLIREVDFLQRYSWNS